MNLMHNIIRDNFCGKYERFAHFSAKNFIEIALIGEKKNMAKCSLAEFFAKISS